MEPVDTAFQRFAVLRPEIEAYLDSVKTEAEVRLKIIDRILTDVLHWPYDSIEAEPHTGAGYADYALLEAGLCRVIIEAKRDGRSFDLSTRRPGASYKISGGVFQNPDIREGIDQGIRYCGEKSAELACVTNGREWVIFRGSRLGDGRATRDGFAFAFPGLAAIEQEFQLFYNLMSRESVCRFDYRPYFHEAEGQPVRTSVFQKALREPGSARRLPGSQLAADIDRMMSQYFQRLTGDSDPGMLEACFVETAESVHADNQLARIAGDIIERIQELDTGQGEALTRLVERVSKAGRHEFVLIVGTKGAGKTTFITRFFKSVLPESLVRTSVVLRTDLREHSGDVDDIIEWLTTKLIDEAETGLFTDGQPSFRELQGMFFDEYSRLSKGPWAALYESDPSHVQFHIKFGEMIEDMRSRKPQDFLRGIIRHIVSSRKKLPVLVFDNADHFDIGFQQAVYQYARSLYEPEICLVILPVTDRTSWQLTKHGALQSFEHESFFLPTPRTDEVIRKRIEFIDSRLELDKVAPADRYSISGNLHLSIKDLTAFTQALQHVFLQTSQVSEIIGDLANHDVRRTLQLARGFISSPHLRVDDLVTAYLSGSAVELPASRAVKALVRQKYDIYPLETNEFVQPIYSLNLDVATTPLLGVRILRLLSDVVPDERRQTLLDVDRIEAYFAGMGVENRAVRLWLDSLLKKGLVLDFDPTTSEIEHSRQVELAPSGRQHLYWSIGNWEFINAMMDVTPFLTERYHADLKRDERVRVDWHIRTATFIEYLLEEDLTYCTLPRHEAYSSQQKLSDELDAVRLRLSEWTTRPRRTGR